MINNIIPFLFDHCALIIHL